MFRCINYNIIEKGEEEKIYGWTKRRKHKFNLEDKYFKIFDTEDGSYSYCTSLQMQELKNAGILIDNYNYDKTTLNIFYFDLNSYQFGVLKQRLRLIIKNMSSPCNQTLNLIFKTCEDMESELVFYKMCDNLVFSSYDEYTIGYNSSTLVVLFKEKLIITGVENFLSNLSYKNAISNSNTIDIFSENNLYNDYRLDLSDVDFSLLKDISSMFCDTCCISVTFNKTLKPVIMDGCFAHSEIQFVDFNSFDTSDLESAKDLFSFCDFESIDLHGLDLSKCKTIRGMFHICRNLKDIDISFLDLKNVVDASDLFTYTSIKSCDTSVYNFDNLENVSSMFHGCLLLEKVNLSGLAHAKIFSYLIYKCEKLKLVDISVLNLLRDGVQYGRLFGECTSLENIIGFDEIAKQNLVAENMFIKLKRFNFTSQLNLVKDCKEMCTESTIDNLVINYLDTGKNYFNSLNSAFKYATIKELTVNIYSSDVNMEEMFFQAKIQKLILNILCENYNGKLNRIFYESDIDELTIHVVNRPYNLHVLFSRGFIEKFTYLEDVLRPLGNSEKFTFAMKIGEFRSNNKDICKAFNKRFRKKSMFLDKNILY